MTDRLYLGCDVGNSKTHLVLADDDGHVHGFAVGPGGNPGRRLYAQTAEMITSLVRRAGGRDVPIESAVLAVAGVDFEDEAAAMTAAFRRVNLAKTSLIYNDTFAVLRAGTDGTDGVAVVAGAGINCVGRYRAVDVRFHSLGRLSGDWGGGMELGLEGIGSACRSQDGRGPQTALQGRVPAHFGMSTPLEVVDAIHRGALEHSRLTELARVVLEVAAEGDAVAVGLARRLGRETVDLVRAAVARLGCDINDLPIVLDGSLLQARNPEVVQTITAGLAALGRRSQPTVGSAPPVLGALLLAYDAAAVRVDDRAALEAGLIESFAGQPSR